MNTSHLKQTTIAVAIALGGSALMAQSVLAATASKPETSTTKAKQNAHATKQQLLLDQRQKVEREAKDVIDGTRQALSALRKKDNAKATTLLEQVSGKLDILLAKHPDLQLIPADVEAQVYDLDSSPEQVSEMVDTADDLLDDNKVQDARHILSALISEIRISTTSIPLGVFPDAIKEAAALSGNGKTDAAAEALSDVLNMLVTTTDVFPLPVLRAEDLVTQASELEHKDDLSKEESRKAVLKSADAAKQQLKLAEVLGYGDKKDYQQLYASIDEIKDVIHSEKSDTFWKKTRQSLFDFKQKIMHAKK